MNGNFKILGIAGSLREKSFNRSLLRATKELVKDTADIEIFELHGIPGFNQDNEQNPPQEIIDLKQKIRDADAVLFVTPEYNYSVSGVLKNAIDWASRPYGDNAFDGKPAAVMGASISMLGTARAQYHLRQMAVFLNMHMLNQPEVMVATASDKFDDNGDLIDDTSKDLIRKQISNLEEFASKINAEQTMHAH